MPQHPIAQRTHFTLVVTVAVALAALASCVAAQTSDEQAAELAKRLQDVPAEEQLDFLVALEAGGRRDAALYFHLGNAFFNREQPDSAVVYYQRAIEADSVYSKAWVNMGLAYEEQHKRVESQRAFKQALKINAEDVLAYCHLGFSYFASGRVREAIDMYEKALAIDSRSAQAHYNLGLAFADAKVFREALHEWELVVEIDGDGQLGRAAAENVELIRTYLELEDD